MHKIAEGLIGWAFVLLAVFATIGGVVIKLADISSAHPGGGDLATWIGAVFAGLAFAGTIFIATAQQRQLQKHRIDKAKIFAPAISMKLSLVRPALELAIHALSNTSDDPLRDDRRYWGNQFGRLALWSDVELEPLICIPGDVAVNLTIVREAVLITGKAMRAGGNNNWPVSETITHLSHANRYAESAQAAMQKFFDAHSHLT